MKPLTLETIETKLKGYRAESVYGDHTLNAGLKRPATRAAAVLILLIRREDGLSVLFTKRTAHLPAHAGQVSFPGGRAEPDDVDAAATALREAEEEIGLPRSAARVIGLLDEYITQSGFQVRPVVAYADESPAWNPDAAEVEHIFEVPLSYIMEPGRLAQQVAEDRRRYYACTWQGFCIWGATAGMLKNFVDVVCDS